MQQDLRQGKFSKIGLCLFRGLTKVMLIVFDTLISVKALFDDGEVIVGEEISIVWG